MSDFVEIALSMRGGGTAGVYYASVRAHLNEQVVDQSFGPFEVAIDRQRLLELALNPDKYGQILSKALFDIIDLRAIIERALGRAEERGVPLRLRLDLDPQDADLHALRWELLRVPGENKPLCIREDILFSRFRPVPAKARAPKRREKLRALVAVASPNDLARLQLTPIQSNSSTARALDRLEGMDIDYLGTGFGRFCTLHTLAQRIPGHDILYLVCHGKMIQGEPYLVLEDDKGLAQPVRAKELAMQLYGVNELPRLAILTSCESAEFNSAGPLLVEAGIPSVIAFHGELNYPTADRFLPALFEGLKKKAQATESGIIDKATASARRQIVDRLDFWSPVLFMGLRNGQLWADDEEDVPNLITVANDPMNRNQCTFRYACFISSPGDVGRQEHYINRFTQELRNALEEELREMLMLDNPVYYAPEHLADSKGIARALCESACMILVLTPKYFNQQIPRCACEYIAMKKLEQKRLLTVEIPNIPPLVIPVFPYSENVVPLEVLGPCHPYEFSEHVPGNLLDHPVYRPRVRRIAEQIANCYNALEGCLENPCGECGEFQLPEPGELQKFFGGLPKRMLPKFVR